MSSYTTFNANTTTTDTNATFTGMNNGRYHNYRVSAITSEGEGAPVTSAKTLILGPPSAVTSLETTAVQTTNVNLSWNKPVSSGGKKITGYKVEYKGMTKTVSNAPTSVSATAGNTECVVSWVSPTDPADFGYSEITGYVVGYAPHPSYSSWTDASTNSSPYTVTGLENYTAYKFRVSVINSQGPSAASTLNSAVTPQAVAPDPPTSLSISGGNARFTGSWTPPAYTGGSVITGYDLMYAPGSPLYDSWTTVPLGNVTTWTVLDLSNGTSYKFKVSAKNIAGTGTESAPSSAVTLSDILPSAPTGVLGTSGNEKVSLTWTASNDNGGPAISYYKIEYKESTASWPATPLNVDTNNNNTSKDVTGLENGTTYNFRVYAITSNGTGPASDETGDVTPNIPFSISSTGGIVTTYTSNSINYTVYEFRYTGGTSGTQTTYTFTVSGSKAAEVFIVGGGGCGGSDGGGGGGGGGVVYDPNITLGAGDYTVRVGNGGDINIHTSYFGEKGSDSEIITTNPTTAITTNLTLPFKGKGGGAGYPRNKDGANELDADGGSGGGADHAGGTPRPAGDSDQGNTYWNGSSWVAGGHSGGVSYKGGAGGGGAGGAAPNQTSNSSNNGSAGGPGVDNNWLGDDNGNNKGTGWRNYAAGGGGGHWQGVGGAGGQSASNPSANTKGSGGGGRGGIGNPTPVHVIDYTHNSVHGKEHRGGGGGGEGHNGRGDEGNGGSGIVLIRYVTS